MAVDNTHTKYLHGHDKKVWTNYKDAYEANKKLERFFDGLTKDKKLSEGEEYDVPVRKNVKKQSSND